MKFAEMKFADMPSGQWFRDQHGRCFVKLQNLLPSGIHIIHYSSVYSNKQPEQYQAEANKVVGKFNAIDSNGIPATCPDWLEFELIANPFVNT